MSYSMYWPEVTKLWQIHRWQALLPNLRGALGHPKSALELFSWVCISQTWSKNRSEQVSQPACSQSWTGCRTQLLNFHCCISLSSGDHDFISEYITNYMAYGQRMCHLKIQENSTELPNTHQRNPLWFVSMTWCYCCSGSCFLFILLFL